MRKILLSAFAAVSVLIAALTMSVFAIASDTEQSGVDYDLITADSQLTYQLDDSGMDEQGVFYSIDSESRIAYVDGVSDTLADSHVVIPSYVLTNGAQTYPVTRINSYVFNSRTDISALTLPSTLRSVGQDAFKACNNLSAVYIDDLEAYFMIEYESYRSNPLYFAKDLYLGSAPVTDLVIPETVSKINGYALISGSFSSITLHDKLTEIGMYAFYGCSNITAMTVPDSVTEIGVYAFRQCTSLESVTLSNSLKKIDNALFYGSGIKSIVIPEGVETVSYYAFYGCTSLTTVTVPSSVTNIGSKAFYNCTNLGVVHISDLDAWCRIAFDGDYYANPAFYSKKLYLNGTRVTSVVFPEGIEKVNDFVFINCKDIKTVSIPDSVISIGEKAFYNINNMTDIVIPREVTSIGIDAFRGCNYLSSITMWGKVSSIGNNAFYGCSKLANIYYLGTAEQWTAMTVGTNNDPLSAATLNYFCNHAYGEYLTDTEPTCTDTGMKYRVCSICNETEQQQTEALGHDYSEWIVDVEPTDMIEGAGHRVCFRCSFVESASIDKVVIDADLGDLDADGTVTNRDIALIVRGLTGWDIWSEGGYFSLADVNEDTRVNNRDAIELVIRLSNAQLAEKYEGYTAIYTAEQLADVKNDLCGKYYLASDIDLGGSWISIGNNAQPFSGILDGNGHTVSGISYSSKITLAEYAGLIGYNTGVITDLTAEGSISITTSVKSNIYAGGIAAYNAGTITNCTNNVEVSVGSDFWYAYAGGIAGYTGTGSSIVGCTNNAQISSMFSKLTYSGGIASYAASAKLSDCINNGIIISSVTAGGMAGQITDSEIYNSTNNGAITANCSYESSYGGGITGCSKNSKVSVCSNTATVNAGSYAGGIVGRNYGVVENSYNTACVNGCTLITSCYAGGVVGLNESNAAVENAYSTSTVTSIVNASSTKVLSGGVAGANSGSMTNCYYLSTMTKGAGTGNDTATKLTLANMKSETSFAGFDFESVWIMGENSPELR